MDLFELPELTWSLPALWQEEIEDRYDEMDLLGFPLQSPFSLLASPVLGIGVSQLAVSEGQWVAITGYLITYKRITAKNGRPMVFGYFMDANGQYFDTTHFPQTVERYPLRGAGLYVLEGKVILEFGFPSLKVRWLEKCALRADPSG